MLECGFGYSKGAFVWTLTSAVAERRMYPVTSGRNVSYHPAAISPQAIRRTFVFTWYIGSRDGGTASAAGRTSRLLGGYAYVAVDGSALGAAQNIAGLHHLACAETVRMNCCLARWARPRTL